MSDQPSSTSSPTASPTASAPLPLKSTEPTPLPHLSARGDARMVDVSGKPVTVRTATATGRVLLSAECVAALRDARLPKGDALAVARIAGIQGAKRTAELVPLCHPLALSGVDVELDVVETGVEIRATVRTTDRTGVEMEALTAVSTAALTVVDMIKAVDRAAVITDVSVLHKSGGRRGPYDRGDRADRDDDGTPIGEDHQQDSSAIRESEPVVP